MFIIIFLDSPRDGQDFSKIHFEGYFYVHLFAILFVIV